VSIRTLYSYEYSVRCTQQRSRREILLSASAANGNRVASEADGLAMAANRSNNGESNV
jgi:hypothetical protein